MNLFEKMDVSQGRKGGVQFWAAKIPGGNTIVNLLKYDPAKYDMKLTPVSFYLCQRKYVRIMAFFNPFLISILSIYNQCIIFRT